MLFRSQRPRDPVSENMAILNGKPTKAFIYQDHEAHIASHTSFIQDPTIAAQIGQNPLAQKIQAAAMAHIAEHLAFQYRRQVEEQLGVPLPPPYEELPEDLEIELSRLVAEGAAQVLQANKAKAAKAQAEQAAQDPIVQMQQAELQIKGQEIAIKSKKIEADIQKDQANLQLQLKKAQDQKEIEMARIQANQKQANQKVQVDLFKRGNK